MQISNWQNVDAALMILKKNMNDIDFEQIKLAKDVKPYTEKIDKAREKTALKIAPLKEQNEDLEEKIERFAREHDADFEITKEMIYGSVSLKKGKPGTKLLEKADVVLKLVKKQFKSRFIRKKEEIDKTKILAAYPDKISDEQLKEVGIEIVQDKNFSYKVS